MNVLYFDLRRKYNFIAIIYLFSTRQTKTIWIRLALRTILKHLSWRLKLSLSILILPLSTALFINRGLMLGISS